MKQRIKQCTSCLVTAIGFIAAFALSGCSKEGDMADNNPGSEIRLTSSVQVQSRAGTAPDTQITNGEKVAVYVDEAASPATQLYGNNVLTADGNGRFSGGTAMYFPASGNKVDIYAFHTNARLESDFPTMGIEHSVAADQTMDYVSSDLLYAVRKGVSRSTPEVDLTFYHLLAKVAVVLKPGAGMTTNHLDGAVVTIESTYLKAGFMPKKVDLTDPPVRSAMIAPRETTPAAITIPTATTADFSSVARYGEGIIVPQPIEADQPFIRVELANGAILTYKLDTYIHFETGRKYTYQITVNLTGLTATATIGDWDKVEVNGDATIPDPIGNKTPARAAAGDFYMNDGTLVDKDAALTNAQKSACIGIVYWVGDITEEDPLLKRNKPGCTHGLVMALQDAAENSFWSSNYEDIAKNWLSGQGGTYGITTLHEIDKMQGYANTAALNDYNESDNVSNDPSLKVLPIGIIAEYAKSHPTPESSSGWYWPSLKELEYMCWGQNNSGGVAGKRMLDKQLGILGIESLQSGYYWSSSEQPGAKLALTANFEKGSWGMYSKNTKQCGVRAVLAF